MGSRYDAMSQQWGNHAENTQLGGEKAQFVDRVLDVRQGELCWVVGTVYMEMALKPNVLDDISKEVTLTLPKHRANSMLTHNSTGLQPLPPDRPTCPKKKRMK